MANTDNMLSQVDHFSLNDFAEFLERSADQVRELAVKNSIKPEEQQAGAIDFLLRTPRIVMRHLKSGHSLDDAMALTAKETGAPVGSINRAWRRFCQDKSLYELRRRNRLIIELAAMGFTNAQIGKKVNMHPHSISRIISAARRVHHQARTAQKNVDLVLNGGMLPPSDSAIF